MRRTRRYRTQGLRPAFSVPQILRWADEFHHRHGQWPHMRSGRIPGMDGEDWRKVDSALRIGLRGLQGGSSLARLLAERRGVRNQKDLPPLTIPQILTWADAHRKRTGAWPIETAGPIVDAPGETWRAVDQALRVGVRGQKGRTSLAQVLEKFRGVRNIQTLPRLSSSMILKWAEAYHRRTGQWPRRDSGPIPEAPGENWKAVHAALVLGRRGLPGGSSLIRLLAKHHGVRNPKQLPLLTIKQILAWARAHRRRTGQWPSRSSGPIVEAPRETWSAVHAALMMGCRGLPAGLTLKDLLTGEKSDAKLSHLPPLAVSQILSWADAHYRCTQSWPNSRSGPIVDAPGETWRNVDQALHKNQRGLQTGLTLVQLLTKYRGLRTRQYAPPLTEQQILSWAQTHFERTGFWPSYRSGPIPEAPGESWRGIDAAVRSGSRGLKTKMSLAALLAQRGGVRNRTNLPKLKLKQILTWAKAHHQRTGAWPNSRSGPIKEAPFETWKGVDMAVRGGYRGLPGGPSLAQLLAQLRGVRNRTNLPILTYPKIRAWADAYYHRIGTWPTRASGAIVEAPGETWSAVEIALRQGHRGLPGGSSLSRLLHRKSTGHTRS